MGSQYVQILHILEVRSHLYRFRQTTRTAYAEQPALDIKTVYMCLFCERLVCASTMRIEVDARTGSLPRIPCDQPRIDAECHVRFDRKK